ncbi:MULTISPECIES: threonine ammonia-lyase IlvA [Roseinatronobacter]|uniref:L-threonine dehydratase n=1 Tax=Roseinatronobacter domitianus TaxID=2940293 RepID=A0ABT0M4L9_9RHOB|nr:MULTISPECIES: threonine ammonia-lyase IlvA [Roseibaca]MCL1629593.1 threonine ammonia-lyase IlvA [Roseibaca domitiana]
MSDFATRARAACLPMRELFPPTPLLRNDYLSQKFGADIWLKREDLSPVRSYKIRGAFNAMRKQLDRVPEGRAFVCASAGNHAQGVAFACRHFGVQGTIFMPVTTPQQKIMKTRSFGAEHVTIQLIGDTFDQSLAAAQAFCTERGAHFLSPFDDEDVIEGQASVAVEMLEQLDHAPDMVVLPVGGGGLSAGMTSYLAQTAPDSALRYVEPLGGASLQAALRAGEPVTLPRIDSFVDGASVARIGARTFARLKHVDPDHVLIAPENRICITMLDLLNVEGLVLEPAGALSLDVLESLRGQIAGKTVVCVVSGGNFDFERLPEVKERAMRFAGSKKYLLLRLPQRPGALRDFLGTLGPEDDIARFEYLKKTARNFGTVLLGIETTNPDNFNGLFARLDDAGFAYSDITEDEIMANFVI